MCMSDSKIYTPWSVSKFIKKHVCVLFKVLFLKILSGYAAVSCAKHPVGLPLFSRDVLSLQEKFILSFLE